MPTWTDPLQDELDTTFIDAIARGWGLSLNCQPCGVYTRWTDAELAKRFILQLDRPMAEIRGRVKCPECGDKARLKIYAYNAGAMNWNEASQQTSDMLAIIEGHKAQLREMARTKLEATEPPSPASYAGAKMRS